MRLGIGSTFRAFAALAAVGAAMAQVAAQPFRALHKRLSFLNSSDPAAARHGNKLNGQRSRRGKYKGRLHARKGAKRRGSGRTAKCIKQKARRHG